MSAGEMHDIDVDSEDVIKVAQFAVSVIQRESKSNTIYKVNRILHARSQVVSGIKYDLIIEVGTGDRTSHIERAEVYHQHWNDEMILQNHYPLQW
jgi:hypothetical protein